MVCKSNFNAYYTYNANGKLIQKIDNVNSLKTVFEQNKVIISRIKADGTTTLVHSYETKSVSRIFAFLETTPIIDIKKTSSDLNMSYNTVSNLIIKLQKLGVLKQVGENQRRRCFAYEEYLSILRKGT
jgi:Fic family protein